MIHTVIDLMVLRTWNGTYSSQDQQCTISATRTKLTLANRYTEYWNVITGVGQTQNVTLLPSLYVTSEVNKVLPALYEFIDQH